MLSSKYHLFCNFHQKMLTRWFLAWVFVSKIFVLVSPKKLSMCPGLLGGARAVKVDHLCYLWKTFYTWNTLIMTLNDHLYYNSVIFHVILEWHRSLLDRPSKFTWAITNLIVVVIIYMLPQYLKYGLVLEFYHTSFVTRVHN